MRAFVLVISIAPAIAAADASWPVRLNLSTPLGTTWGTERMHGATWGLRAAATVYPTNHGVAFGASAEMLLDFETHGMSTFATHVTMPLADFGAQWRVGAYGGVRFASEPGDDEPRFVAGVLTQLAVPAYLYEIGLDVRLDATLRRDELSAGSLLVDVDLLALVAAVGAAHK